MLVLSRSVQEKIYVGDDVVITLVRIDRGQVRIGIQCPRNVPIYRDDNAPPAVAARIEEASKGLRYVGDSVDPVGGLLRVPTPNGRA
ncbi:carbon storage regulator [Fimbriiglobus ruber]|uniref:Translational regulator CsrA n=1 Tax=Fimbriiglobus ruber TaxID=1908690 RepID=A0A225CYB6_9BACT|nr:carbon storage regulator [Fimbriiglobus ruber]OWK34370.1 Carbon storage regulator [Fimbriiglobus ruber]